MPDHSPIPDREAIGDTPLRGRRRGSVLSSRHGSGCDGRPWRAWHRLFLIADLGHPVVHAGSHAKF